MKTLRNHIEEGTKIMILAASVIVTCMVVGAAFLMEIQARQISQSAVGAISDLQTQYTDYQLSMYDDLEVTGSDVRNLLKRQLGDIETGQVADISIIIKTGKGSYTYIDNTYLSNTKNVSDIRYIKPTATFLGSITRNQNGVIISLTFEQK